MEVPRDLSGAELIKALCRDWDYRQVHQEGSQPGCADNCDLFFYPMAVRVTNAAVMNSGSFPPGCRKAVFN
jgi:hypothetical protein